MAPGLARALFSAQQKSAPAPSVLPPPYETLTYLSANLDVAHVTAQIPLLIASPFVNGPPYAAVSSLLTSCDVAEKFVGAGLPQLAMTFMRRAQDEPLYGDVVNLCAPSGAPLASHMQQLGLPPSELLTQIPPGSLGVLGGRNAEIGLTGMTGSGIDVIRSNADALVNEKP